MRCCVICKKKQNGNGSFFRPPNDERRRRMWMDICQVNFKSNSYVCEEHFAPADIIKGGRIFLMPSAVPRIGIPKKEIQHQQEKENLPALVLPSVEHVNEKAFLPPQVAFPCMVPHSVRNQLQSANTSPLATQLDQQKIWNELNNSENLKNSSYKIPNDCQQFLNLKTTVCFPAQTKKNYREQATQTYPVIVNDPTGGKTSQYEKIRSLTTKIKDLEIELAQANAAVDRMRSIFTDGQIRKLKSPGEIKWRWEDISEAICLHASGPRAYNHLYAKGFPLPHVATLHRWCRKINISEGLITTAIDFMKRLSDLSSEDKICVLAFDEMKVMETFDYDAVRDIVQTPANYVQVVMARGLRKSWKQPVFFNFDCQMTTEILNEIITALHFINFPVVAIVCDNGPSNRKLWRSLGVTSDTPWFPHPVISDDKVFAFSDAPHLLKLIRNHFIDSGFIINGELLTSRAIFDVLKHTADSDVSIAFKLSFEHLSVKGSGRQKVKPAAQIFSNTTASAIRRCYSIGLDVHKPTETADFVQLVNDWFDILNSSLSTFGYPGKEPFGNTIQVQLAKLEEMNRIMSFPILPQKSKTNKIAPFQNGILITNKALVMLHQYVKEKFNMQYICTNRLNQDVLEHLFGSKGGLNDHPSPKEFKYRLRKYIMARNTEHLSDNGNVTNDKTEWLSSESQHV